MYTTKTTSQLTAIKPETLRTWERRFGFPKPNRDEKGRRVYSADDIEKLSLIASLTRAGHPIRSLADLSHDDLKQLQGQPNRRVQHPEEEQLMADLTSAIERKSLKRFRFLIGYSLSLHVPVLACEHILVPICRLIGEKWQSGELSIGYEHALSSIIREELITIIRSLRIAANKKSIVFTTPLGENHEIGLLMAGYIAVSKGFDSQFWGANIPAEDLAKSLIDMEAQALVMSIVKSDNLDILSGELEKISNALPRDILFWVGLSPNIVGKIDIPERVRAFESYEPYAQNLDFLNV